MSRLAFNALALFISLAASLSEEPLGNLSPSEALRAFETEPGLLVELVAAEPLVRSPCALAFDEQGRLFVAENIGYPLGGPNGEAQGRIALLRDADGDGRLDQRVEFATGLTFPNGLMPWHGGLIVTCAPDVLWFKDTDDDGQSDEREILLTGFDTNGSTQLRVNDPTLGPDGWVYLAGGLRGGIVFSPRHPERKLDLAKTDVKFRPDTGEIASVDGKSQFGHTFDDAGHRFLCMNRVPIQHAPLPAHYLARHPRVNSPGTLHNCSDLIENTLLIRQGNSGARIFPISANITTADSHEGTYSAACAVHIARGEALPGEYQGQAWSCDPTANLLRCDRLEPAGPTFAARRMRNGSEALRSRDNWFRPVFLADGPDGALYVADMYRRTIEHPEYLPEEVRKNADFDSGKHLGRIWRLRDARRDFHRRAASSRLKPAAALELVNSLSAPDGWTRDTAFRLLMEHRPTNNLGSLFELLPKPLSNDQELLRRPRAASDSPTNHAAAGRVCALNLLAELAGWSEPSMKFSQARETNSHLNHQLTRQLLPVLVAATVDEAPGVRENALQRLGLLPDIPISDDLLGHWAADPHPRVRFQAALTLGGWANRGALDALGRIAVRDGSDRWTRAAILSGLRGRELEFLDRMMQDPGNLPAPAFMFDLGRLVGAAGAAPKVAERPWSWPDGGGVAWKLAFWSGAAEGLREGGLLPADTTPEQAFRLKPQHLTTFKALAASVLREHDRSQTDRETALGFIRQFPGEADRIRILSLLDPREPAELQAAALRTVLRPGPLNAAREVLQTASWSRFTPAQRVVALNSLLVHPDNWPALLDALESRSVPANALTPSQREQLRKARDEAIRDRAGKLLAGLGGGDRKRAFEDARACLALKPVPANGHAVFTRLCANCHRFNREGVAVGPDLFDIRTQPKESILLHIVLPEQEIAPNFTHYICETKDGRTLSGLLTAESPASITLKQAAGVQDTVPREEIVSLTASPTSLMPEELEKGMTHQELADLLAYLRGEQ